VGLGYGYRYVSGFAAAGFDFKELAQIHIDKDTGYSGSASAITVLNADGTLGLNPAVIGSGAAVEMKADGLFTDGGKYLRSRPSGAYYHALIVVDMTRNGDPTAASGDIINLDTTVAERVNFRYTLTNPQALLPNGKLHTFRSYGAGNGTRNTYAIGVDYEANTATVIDADGLTTEYDLGAGATNLNLFEILYGKTAKITVHQMDVFLAGLGESLPITTRKAWELVGNKSPSPYTPNLYSYVWAIGQSLEVGFNPDPSVRTDLENENRPAVLQMAGFENGVGATVHLHGPGTGNINQAVPATGFQQVDVAANAPVRFLAALTAAEVRQSYGLPIPTQIIQGTAIAGQDAYEFDDDDPTVTGTLGTTYIDNTDYVAREAKRLAEAAGGTFEIPILTVLQGAADRSLAAGEYYTRMKEALDDNLARVLAITGETPPVYMYQTAGGQNTATAGVTLEVKQDQLDLVNHFGGVLVGPVYPYETHDGAHPTLEESRKLADLCNWAQAEVESSNGWNLIPTATLNGTTITVTAPCRSDESLEIAPDPYAGGRIADLGFEVTGANVTGTSVSGNTVTITCDAAPTEVRYAFQLVDASASGDMYPAAGGLIRTTLSKTVGGRALYRWLPSFKATL